MTLNELAKLILKQAEDKGWGHTKDTLVVSEKMMLIATEITELRDAMHKKTTRPKDTIESEIADILLRTLHLGRAWDIDFDSKNNGVIHFKSHHGKITDRDLLYLHDLVSICYDYYRHRKLKLFKRYLLKIAIETIALANSVGVDIYSATLNKININVTRTWDLRKLNDV
jgi:NTP pyrophosphatase (non-canonical NTP hydrolase)